MNHYQRRNWPIIIIIIIIIIRFITWRMQPHTTYMRQWRQLSPCVILQVGALRVDGEGRLRRNKSLTTFLIYSTAEMSRRIAVW